ncbi:uncharacterized protein LOC133192528 isoform X2 [Saccostrea echinata]|uniref:uncharacterized protein LOC133192528 isoform X2 n=1 Tax=Saccostrea echinata TaxID=191078 RepID=UPI002A83D55F|nr:uncharacterized protein LOC133192528 isoform X2 [Saccostrea echinata]
MMLKIILQVAIVVISVGARSEVTAGTNTITNIRPPMAKCSALSCEVSATVQSEYDVKDQWVIFKNNTAMRITDWNTDKNKYTGAKSVYPENCKSQCNYTVTLVIQRPDQFKDYGFYQLILKSYDSQRNPYDQFVINFTVPTTYTDIERDDQELPFTTVIVIAVAGTFVAVFICLTVCILMFCRKKNSKNKKPHKRRNRPHSSLGVSTHLYDEVESVATNAYCELNDESRKTSAHQYIQPIPEETPIYKAPEIFSNTESPTSGRAQTQESTKDTMGYLQPSIKFRPDMMMINELYEEANKPRDKKPLEPTYSNAGKFPVLPRKDSKTLVEDLQSVLEKNDKDNDNEYAQPCRPLKTNITNQLYAEANKSETKTTEEPTYGNEQRPPLLPKKVSRTVTVDGNPCVKESLLLKSDTPIVPPKPFSRNITNQLYDERENLYSQKKQLTATYSNPPAIKLPTRKFSRSRSDDSELSHVHSYNRDS